MCYRSRCRSAQTSGWEWASRRIAAAVRLSLLLLFAAGCGSSDPLNRKPLKGKVTVDGTAVPNGSVSFEPLVEGGISSGAVITGGAYYIAKESGLPPGKYRVRITGNDGKGFPVSAGKMPGDEIIPPTNELVPPDWNTASAHEIEITEQGPFTFDFPITTSASQNPASSAQK